MSVIRLGRAVMQATSQMETPMWRQVKVAGSAVGFRGKFVDIESPKKHAIGTDERKTDEAPTPLHLLLSSLAGCEQATLVMLSGKMGVKVHNVDYEVQGDFDVRGMMGVPGVTPRFQKVKVLAKIKADATDEQLDNLVKMTQQRCPVAALFHDAGVQMDVKFERV